ncbi:MAG: RiPP maturation radical SAM C-methyltransferase, partial [Actinomycetota bacterium]
ALHERFSFVDIVCSGEADRSFPAIVQRVAERRRIDEVPGVVFRSEGRSITTGHAPMIGDLDSLPSPSYDDYFASKEACASATEVTPVLLLETSRGCWWGAKHHCTFCGLNGGTMAFRSKSAERVVEEIRSLTSRYDMHTISVVDNILDMRYFKTLLPMLADEGLPMNLFYEVKANLTLEQVRLLWAAGIRHVQPGIESLSDHVLDLMDKGTTALQNVQLLKWCREFGIRPEWNFLYGFPGENAGDYDAITALIDSIDFLEPPSGHGPIRLDRFSPYHDSARSYGLTNVRAMKPYESLYPFDAATLSRVAYYFDFDYADARDPIAYAGPAIDRMRRWMASGPVGALWMIELGDRLALVDRRGVERISTLEGWRADVYRACDRATSISSLLKVAPETPEADIRTFLDGLVGRRLMVAVKERYLALAVHRPPRTSRVEEPNRVALRLVEAS